MSEEVVTTAEESQKPVAPVEGFAPAEATPEAEDVATWKKRLAGKDQALTAAQKALESLKTEAENLKRWKAEQEQASMSEFEKAQVKLAALESELNQTKEYARMERIRASAPTYAQFIADTAGLDEEARAVAFEKFLADTKRQQDEEKGISSDAVTNVVSKPTTNTRKDAAPAGKRTIADIEAELRKLGNPFLGM
jgi:cysteinyl-tRNA synthetase